MPKRRILSFSLMFHETKWWKSDAPEDNFEDHETERVILQNLQDRDFILTTKNFRLAIQTNAIEIIRYGLFSLAQEAQTQPLSSQIKQEIIAGLYECLKQGRLTLLKLIFAYLPALKITFPHATPLAYAQEKIRQRDFAIQKQQSNLQLSYEEEEILRCYDPEKIKNQYHTPMQDQPPVELTQLKTDLTKAILYQDHATLHSLLKSIRENKVLYLSHPTTLENHPTIMPMLYDSFKMGMKFGLEQRCINTLMILHAWLPDSLGYPASTPYEFYQAAIQAPTQTKITLSEAEHAYLAQFNPEAILAGVASEYADKITSADFLPAIRHNRFTTKNQALDAYAHFITQLTSFFNWMTEKNGLKWDDAHLEAKDVRAPSLRLVDAIRHRYEKYAIPTRRLNADNVNGSPFYYQFLSAIENNNVAMSAKCIQILRDKNIPLAPVLLFQPEENKSDTYDYFKKNKSMLVKLFDKKSLSILTLFCTEPEALTLIQDYIRSNNLVENSIEYHRGDYSHFLLMLLHDPNAALSHLNTEPLMAVIGFEDLFPPFSSLDKLHEREITIATDRILRHFLCFSPNLKKISEPLDLRYKIANFIRTWLPYSSLLEQLYLPLGDAEQHRLKQHITRLEHEPSSFTQEELRLPGVKYLFPILNLNRLYQLWDRNSQTRFYLKLYPHGIIGISQSDALLNCDNQVESALQNTKPEQTSGTLLYSSKKQLLNYPASSALPLTPSLALLSGVFNHRSQTAITAFPQQSPSIVSDKKRYVPIAIGKYTRANGLQHHGFWGSYQSYGGKTQPEANHRYDAVVTGACMVGITLYGHECNEQNEIVRTLHLTHPDEDIPADFRIDRLENPVKSHVYEHYTLATLRENIPFMKSVLTQGRIYYDLPTTNYILYGIKFYLKGLFTIDLLQDYITIINEHDALIRRGLDALSTAHSLEILPLSTLDCLGLCDIRATQLIQKLTNGMPEHMNKADYCEKTMWIVNAMLEQLRQHPSPIGLIYQTIDISAVKDAEDPLLALSRIDYAALYAFAKLATAPSENQSTGTILGFMPQDEVQVFQLYGKLFSKSFGTLEAIDWIPTLMPQHSDPKQTKLFYVKYGVETLNTIIDQGLISLQSLLISAIKINNSALYLETMQKIIGFLSKAEEQSLHLFTEPDNYDNNKYNYTT